MVVGGLGWERNNNKMAKRNNRNRNRNDNEPTQAEDLDPVEIQGQEAPEGDDDPEGDAMVAEVQAEALEAVTSILGLPPVEIQGQDGPGPWMGPEEAPEDDYDPMTHGPRPPADHQWDWAWVDGIQQWRGMPTQWVRAEAITYRPTVYSARAKRAGGEFLDGDKVAQYADEMLQGSQFPPQMLMRMLDPAIDGPDAPLVNMLWSGHHRHRSLLGLAEAYPEGTPWRDAPGMPEHRRSWDWHQVVIQDGSHKEARVQGLLSNLAVGLAHTAEELGGICAGLLDIGWGVRAVARRTGKGISFVSNIKSRLEVQTATPPAWRRGLRWNDSRLVEVHRADARLWADLVRVMTSLPLSSVEDVRQAVDALNHDADSLAAFTSATRQAGGLSREEAPLSLTVIRATEECGARLVLTASLEAAQEAQAAMAEVGGDEAAPTAPTAPTADPSAEAPEAQAHREPPAEAPAQVWQRVLLAWIHLKSISPAVLAEHAFFNDEERTRAAIVLQHMAVSLPAYIRALAPEGVPMEVETVTAPAPDGVAAGS